LPNNNIDIKKLYTTLKNDFNHLVYNKKQTEYDLLNIINKLCYKKKFDIYDTNNYSFDEISNLFRFYEDELKSDFEENKIIFHSKFKCYTLLIKAFTELCIIFATNLEKRVLINNFFQLLRESKNILKFTIALDQKYINTLNNIIGEHLYYFSHIQYVYTKEKDIDYILDEYHMNLERQLHGFELSESTSFGDNEFTNKDIEYAIFVNNASFLLLKMLYKLDYYRPDIKYFDNKKFENILFLFHEISLFHKNTKTIDTNSFKEMLVKEFKASADFLLKEKNHNMYEEKLALLNLNTDEYKQLIDIILFSKE